MSNKTTIVLHCNREDVHIDDTVLSIINQTNKDFNIVFIGELKSELASLLNENKIDFEWVTGVDKFYAEVLSESLEQYFNEYILYIDNLDVPVLLKEAALEGFLIAAERNPSAGMFFAEYELKKDGNIKEIHLLDYHIGRVRDNQDFGKVFFFRREVIDRIGGLYKHLKYKVKYDIRLKISELFNIVRISNKYSGSFYTVIDDGKDANVFDYLLSSKDVQLEAEEVLTNHLKRINAYLEPEVFMKSDNYTEGEYTLKASVIIPVGHRPEFIGIAIESVQAQTVKDIEAVIVVNGGNDDPTADVVRKYMRGGELYDETKPEIRLIVIDINNIGLCLNIGVKNARGKYYVQLDSDDRLKPDAVEKVLEAFDSDDNTGMVIGSYDVWEKQLDGSLSRMEDIPVVTHDEWTDENGRNNLLRINGAGAPRCIPIDVIKEMGYFSINDDRYARNYGEDYEMVLKVSEYYKIGRIYDPIYEVIRHSGGTDHAISEDVIMRNNEAKDDMRKHAILRRIGFNTQDK